MSGRCRHRTTHGSRRNDAGMWPAAILHRSSVSENVSERVRGRITLHAIVVVRSVFGSVLQHLRMRRHDRNDRKRFKFACDDEPDERCSCTCAMTCICVFRSFRYCWLTREEWRCWYRPWHSTRLTCGCSSRCVGHCGKPAAGILIKSKYEIMGLIFELFPVK